MFRSLESGLSYFTAIPMDVHRRILARRQRAIVHRTLDYLATHEFSIKVEDTHCMVKETDLNRNDKEVEESDHEVEPCDGHTLSEKCSECCKFFK